MNAQELSDLRLMVAASGSPYGAKAMLEIDRLRAENARQAETIAQQTRAIVELEQERHMLRIEVGSSKVSALRQKQQAETIAKLRDVAEETLNSSDPDIRLPRWLVLRLQEAMKGSQ